MRIVPVINLPLAATDYSGAVDWILDKAAGGGTWAVEAANTHVAALARQDPSFQTTMEQFDLICPDGMPLVWMINAQVPAGEKLRDRVYGPTLLLKTWEATNRSPGKYRHFLLGGQTSTLLKLQQRFQHEFPAAELAGIYSPPFGPWPEGEFGSICDRIRESGANLIWVGLGCPKQERWIAAHKKELPPGVYFGIGAAFAFHAGEVRQAPALLQRIGCEWAFRLAMEPRRLLRRYFTYNFLFLWYFAKDRWTGAPPPQNKPA